MLALLLGGCGPGHDRAGTATALVKPRPVLTAVVEAAAEADAAYTGVVAARTRSDLGFRAGGKVIERHVDPGDRVSPGAVLLVLDVADFELASAAARDRVSAAGARLRQARDDEHRYRDLLERGAVPRQTFDQAATQLSVAEAEHAAALAEAAQLRNRRSYATLRADAAGVITDVLADRGQVVSTGQVVVHLAHDGAREAIVDVPETRLAWVADSATAQPFGDGLEATTARLRELSAAADPITRTYRARYVLDGSAERFPLGSTVTLRMQGAEAPALTRVPIGALHDPGGGVGVWRIGDDGRVTFTPVRVARLEHEHATLRAGIDRGARIVALGAHLLHEDDVVRPLAEAALELADVEPGVR